jgi:DNA-binding NarL/FixJ family response regulator
MPLRALIADDHELFRTGLRQLLLDTFEDIEVREAESLDQAIDILTTGGASELILVDLRMPGMSGAEALLALRDGFPDAKLAVVSAHEDRAEVLAALNVGVHGYIPKSLPATEIANALRTILNGQIYAPALLGRREPADAATTAARTPDTLTARQRDVLDELLKGRSSKEIGRALQIAEGTVKIHLAAIYRALGVRTRAEAIARLRQA